MTCTPCRLLIPGALSFSYITFQRIGCDATLASTRSREVGNLLRVLRDTRHSQRKKKYIFTRRFIEHIPIPAQLVYLHWSSGHDFRLSRVKSRQARETRVRFPDGELTYLLSFLSAST